MRFVICDGRNANGKAWDPVILFPCILRNRADALRGPAFTRKRQLPFPVVCTFLLNLLRASIQAELDTFFRLIRGRDVAVTEVTTSAFCQARQKLRHTAFTELSHNAVDAFYAHMPFQTWWRHRLLAIDGSTIRIPENPECWKHFGIARTKGDDDNYSVARVSQCFDLLNHVIVDVAISPRAIGERQLLVDHLDRLGPGDLVVLDRGYSGVWVLKMLADRDIDYCARIPGEKWTHTLRQFHEFGAADMVIEMTLFDRTRRDCRNHGVSTEPITIRVVRIDNDDDPIFVATSLLDQDLYPTAAIEELYLMRWGVEESYKLLKSRADIENYTGRSVQAVYQDFHAHILAVNLAAISAFPAHDPIQAQATHRKLDYKLNWTQALAKNRNTLFLLFYRPNPADIIDELIEALSRCHTAVRQGRRSPRLKKVRAHPFPPAYKPIS